tara:strand:- start:205 stop:666 length:462 start_codon:yes stop_codon:yes gene_type:complete
MKKNIKIISILACSMLLLSCGFKQIQGKKKIQIQNINISGENRIAYVLKNNISLMSDNNSKNKYDVEINIKKEKKNKIKDLAGKVIRYELFIEADFKLTDLNDNKIIQKKFIKNSDYTVGSSHSGTIDNERNATKNIIRQLSEDINNFITFLN